MTAQILISENNPTQHKRMEKIISECAILKEDPKILNDEQVEFRDRLKDIENLEALDPSFFHFFSMP